MKTYIIVPAYNEEGRAKEVIRQVLDYCKNVIVVNDGSTDNTEQEAKQFPVTVINQKNTGKGRALRNGCDYAIEQGAEVLIVIDADGQHETKDITRLLKALKNNDIVFTYRHFVGTMPFVFRFGNWFISNVASVLFGIKLWDTQCGYRAFRSNVYNKIRWDALGYFMDTEMIIRAGKNNLKYEQVRIKTIYSNKRKGTNVFDGIKIVLKMIKWKIQK